jgi:hypothetical protein
LTDALYTSPNTPVAVANNIQIAAVGIWFDKAQAVDNNNQMECWMFPYSGAIRTTVYGTREIKQGILFAATASVSHRSSPTPHYDYIGKLFGGKFGRVYAMPFLVDDNSISNNMCRTSFYYYSGSVGFTASFSASTSGLSSGNTVVGFLGNIAGTSKLWQANLNISTIGIPLSSIPIRTDVSSSWVAI